MPPTSKISLIEYTEDDVQSIRKSFDIDEKTIKQNVEILKDWLKQQQHLPQVADDDFLERLLLRNKFRIEQTKEKLDDYYTLRGLYFQNIFKDLSKIVPSKESGQIVIMPKLTKSHLRILVARKRLTLLDTIRYTFHLNHIWELLSYNDYNNGTIWIADFKNYNLDDIKQWTLTRVSQFVKLYTKVFSGRFSQIHVVNAPPFFSMLMNILKIALPEKLYKRMKVHSDLSTLYESVPKELLPSDLGGTSGLSCDELIAQLDEVFVEQQTFFEEISKHVSNEKLRIGELSHSDLFGIDGSFKKLDID